jgi:hypothetical protein
LFFRFSWLFDLLRSYRKRILKKKFIFLKFLTFVLINPLSLLYQTKKLKQKIMTTEKLLELLKKEIELNGTTYTERKKILLEMLRMKGVKI